MSTSEPPGKPPDQPRFEPPRDSRTEQLDARHLLCPLPVIRTQNRVAALPVGAVLEVLATDPGVLQDIPAWCRVHGHQFLGAEREGREIRVWLTVRHGRA